MKKTLLIFLLVIVSLYGFGQCTPDNSYAGETFGFWPDASEGLPNGIQDVAYDETITVKAPSNGGEIDIAYSAYPVDSIKINSIDGLPSGYFYQCNNSNCIFPGGTLNCLKISGTTSEIGDFELSINLSFYTTLGGSALAFPYAYSDYSMTVIDPNGIEELTSLNITLNQNVPNPAVDFTVIPFTVKEQGQVTFEVFNLMGEKLYSEDILAKTGENELKYYPDNFNSGIYLYSLTSNGFTQTKRMMIKK